MTREIHMKRSLSLFCTIVLLCGFVLPMTGCRIGRFTVLIPDFDTNVIQGISFWKQTNAADPWECYPQVGGTSECYNPAGSIVFDRVETVSNSVTGQVFQRVYYYNTNDLAGDMGLQHARIRRDPQTGGAIVSLAFYTIEDIPSWYKIKTFNGAGLSPISAGGLTL